MPTLHIRDLALKLDGVCDRDKVPKMLMRSERRLPASFESPEALLREDRESLAVALRDLCAVEQRSLRAG